MEIFEKTKIILDDGRIEEAVAPEILSVSRRTDIPAFYSDWFFERITTKYGGYVDWKNPYSQQTQHVCFDKLKFIVFWSKNPSPMVKYLERLDYLDLDWYLQFTLNDYPENIEPNLPTLEERMVTFGQFAMLYGIKRIIWRYDPVFLIDGHIDIDWHIERIEKMFYDFGCMSKKLVISFADIKRYNKVVVNMRGLGARELTNEEQFVFCEKLQGKLGSYMENGYEVSTCSEEVDLEKFGIKHNSCIDAKLISQLSRDKEFSKRIANVGKDTGQRGCCLCTSAKDIGIYNTCAHGCKYCYANITPESALENFERINKKSKASILI